MAAWTNLIATPTADTTDTTVYVSAAFTPTAGRLVGVFVAITASVVVAPTLVGSANGMLFLLNPVRSIKATSLDTMLFFIADRFTPAGAVSQTVTFTCTSDAATSCLIMAGEAGGMARAGLEAIRQPLAKVDNVLGGTAPATVFAANALTSNITLFGQHDTVDTARTAPVGWTKNGEQFVATPTGSAFYGSRDSGFAATTITSGATTNGTCGALAVELDTSSLGRAPHRGPNYRR